MTVIMTYGWSNFRWVVGSFKEFKLYFKFFSSLKATFGANPIVGAKLLDSRVSSSSVNVAFDDDDQGQDLRRVITQRSEDTLSATPAPRPSQQEQQRKPSKSADDDSVAATSSGGEAAEEE